MYQKQKNTQPKETIDAELTILIVFANKWPKKTSEVANY